MRDLFTAALIAAFSMAGASAARAQAPVAQTGPAAPTLASGWTFTPSLTYAGTWDDNVLLKGQGDSLVGDYENIVNPSGSVAYRGRRNQFSADYSGAFILYNELSALDSFDQRASGTASHRLTQHVTVFGRGSWAVSPTTELVDLTGVPFVRNGSRIADGHGGIDAQLTKRLSVTGTAGLQWVSFKQNTSQDLLLQGGHSVGGTMAAREMLNERTTLTADYDLQYATVGATSAGGTATFMIENAWAGAERRFSDSVRAFGAFGFSRMGATQLSTGRTGPALRAGASDELRRIGLNISYTRSYVPSFSFGGTQQNEDLTSSVRLSLVRRLYTQASLSWQRNEPLTPGELSLKSTWFNAAVGYTLQPWMRIEAFYGSTHQNIDQPGGVLDRHRVGFQVITAKPMRIR